VSHGADIPELNFCSLLIMLLLSLIRGAICIILVKLTISKPRLRVKAQHGEWKFAIERLSLAIILHSSVLLGRLQYGFRNRLWVFGDDPILVLFSFQRN